MKHPPCGCHTCQSREEPKPQRPPKPQPLQSVLLHKILCCERRLYPDLCCELYVTDIPRCAKPPFTLTMVQQSGAQPWWTPLEAHPCDARLPIKVVIPVCCQICDSCGKHYSATAEICVEASLSPACAQSDCWRHQLVINPCVRLKGCPPCSEDCCFSVKLEVTLEMYMTQLTPCAMGKPKQECPDLPLYPQPCCKATPPSWPQCPKDQDPCGWPRQE